MSDKERIGPSPQRGLPQYNIDVRRDGPAVDTAGVIEVRGEVEQCDLSAGGGGCCRSAAREIPVLVHTPNVWWFGNAVMQTKE